MKDNTVTIETASKKIADIRFSKSFNVAVPFIDKHILDGIGDKVAIRVHGGGEVTYFTLHEHVNRAGNALISLGLKRGDRVLMIIKDAPEFFYVFWGAIKAGIIPVPLNTLLRAKDYSFMIEDSAARGIIYSPEYSTEVEKALSENDGDLDIILTTEGAGSTIAKYMSDANVTLDPVKTKPQDDCFWLYSSGFNEVFLCCFSWV